MIRFIFIAVLFIITVTGCKKDKSPVPDCRITKITDPSGIQYVLNHNAEGKLQSVTYNNNSITTFSYSGNTITAIATDNGAFRTKTIYTIGSNGMLASSRIEYNQAGSDWANREYEYSGTQVIKQVLTKDGGSRSDRSFTWINGNPVKEVISNNNTVTQVIEFEYDAKPYQQGDNQYWDLMIQGIEIFRPKNLLKKIINNIDVNTSAPYTEITNYSYGFDGDGKIISMTADGNQTYQYQYQCK